ncbi:MAG: hypothetical protein GXO24_01755 [Chlorobi bacterium]|nr:hypothetical protein [Chlorobiota bacterium]
MNRNAIAQWLAWGISLIFHPIFVPFYAVLLFFYISPYYFYDFGKILRLIFIQAILIPIMVVYLLYQLKILQSFFLRTVKARMYLSLFLAVIYFVLYRSVSGVASLDEIGVLFLGIAYALLISALANAFGIKISLHLVALGGWTAFLLQWSWVHRFPLLDILAPVVLLTGLVAAARYYLKAHGLGELLLGWLTGMVGILLAVMF